MPSQGCAPCAVLAEAGAEPVSSPPSRERRWRRDDFTSAWLFTNTCATPAAQFTSLHGSQCERQISPYRMPPQVCKTSHQASQSCRQPHPGTASVGRKWWPLVLQLRYACQTARLAGTAAVASCGAPASPSAGSSATSAGSSRLPPISTNTLFGRRSRSTTCSRCGSASASSRSNLHRRAVCRAHTPAGPAHLAAMPQSWAHTVCCAVCC